MKEVETILTRSRCGGDLWAVPGPDPRRRAGRRALRVGQAIDPRRLHNSVISSTQRLQEWVVCADYGSAQRLAFQVKMGEEMGSWNFERKKETKNMKEING